MTIKITFNTREVGFVFVKFKNYEFDILEENDARCHRELDFIDTSDIVDMHESKHPTWKDSHELIFTFDSIFLTAESRDKSGDMLTLRMIPMQYIIDIDVRRDDPKLKKGAHKMKGFSKEIVKNGK